MEPNALAKHQMCQIAKQAKGNRRTLEATDHWRTKGQRIHLLSTIFQIIGMIKELDLAIKCCLFLFILFLNNFKFSCIWEELSIIHHVNDGPLMGRTFIHHVQQTFVESLLLTQQDGASTQ